MVADAASMANEYAEFDEDSLERELGLRLGAASALPNALSSPPAEFAAEAEHLGLGDDVRELGRRLYKRISRSLYEVFCGTDPEDLEDRSKLQAALGLGKDAVVTALAGMLVSSFGLGAAVAAILAALIFKRIFKPAGGTVCEYWGEKLQS